MVLVVNRNSNPFCSHGSSSSIVQPVYSQYPNYFLRRPLVRQTIPRRGYPLGYCGTLGNFPFVVLGVDEDDERKFPAIEKTCEEDDNDDKEKKNQEATAAEDELQSIAVRTEMSESAGSRAEIWQQSACAWDRKQLRYNQFRAYELQRKTSEKTQIENERPTAAKLDAITANIFKRNCFKDPLTGKEVRFTKPMVGFGGFVPRYPVLPRPQELCCNPGLLSISKATYKLYPAYEYKRQEFAHKGPLSSAVTTTPPFNPYNKVEKLSLDGKKLLWKRQNHIIKLAKIKNICK